MKQFFYLGSSVFTLFLGIYSPHSDAATLFRSKPLALVYQGPGACTRWKCHEAAARVAVLGGFNVKFVTPAQITPEVFKGASLWVQPGGNAITVANKLGPQKLDYIRKFVRSGGLYIGFCAGAFLTDHTVDDDNTIPGLGIIPVPTYDYPVDSKEDGIPLWINWNGKNRMLFFNGGGSFRLNERRAEYVTPFAWFPDGSPAAIVTTYGLGGVAVTGAHPEAFLQWKTDAKFQDVDGDDIDLALDLLRRAEQAGLSTRHR